ncbi:MAG: sulfatase-like hydrolase/transferase [Verrucomicrobia bacterium]|nr:sulfatase-like hydrolase/transferase [Verrucomicrobiota bacterium]
MIKDRPTLIQKSVIALVVALVTFSKQIGFFLITTNRYYLHWEFADSLALLVGVLILAAIALGISVILKVRQRERVRHFYNHVFLLALANGILTLAPPRFAPQFRQSSLSVFLWSALWLSVVGTIACSFFNRRFPLVRYAGNVCLIFSPLVPILFYQTLAMRNWSSPKESHPDLRPELSLDSRAAPEKKPVFIFVFDEWSYVRSTRDDEFIPELVNLRRLAGQSFFFRQAWSFASQTLYSLPALVFQTDRLSKISRAGVFFSNKGKSVAATAMPNIFSLAKNQGYFTALEGFYHPYGQMAGRHLDYCRAFSVYPTAQSFWAKVLLMTSRNLFWFTDPLTKPWRWRLTAALEGRNLFELNNWMRAETLRLLKECPANTLAFFHVPLPHGPYVFNADGSYNGPFAGNPVIHRKPTVEDYRRHLLHMDNVIGQIVDELKKAGKFDDAMLIVTSDHSWREDPDNGTEINYGAPSLRKVPLLIKFPGQSQAQFVDKTIYNHLHLQPIIERAVHGGVKAQDAAELIAKMEVLPTPTGRFSVRPASTQKSEGTAADLEKADN